MKKIIVLALLTLLFEGCITAQKNNIDLSGEWMIKLDPEDKGLSEQWFNNEFNDRITLPGSLQEQGYGYDIDIHTRWTGQIVDSTWYNAPEYEKYRQKEDLKAPFWLNPEKHYVGVAWYRKDVDIPSSWKGKTLLLELERTHWETNLFVDGKEIGHQDGISTPHRYELTGLEPGKHNIVLRIDNRVHIPVGINSHSVSDHTQSNWNGVIGKLMLSVKPQVSIEDVQIYPDLVAKKVTVNVSVKGLGKARLSFQIVTPDGEPVGTPTRLEQNVSNGVMSLEAVVNAGNNIRLWSEHTPDFYRLKTTVTSSGESDERYTNFGFREFKKVGTRFHVNGQPTFLRGTLECCIFPLTGYPSTDAKYWEKIYRSCREFGLNHIRFHSWCPPEIAFHVADSMGLYLQVECGAWSNVGEGGYIDEWLYAEGERILKEHGNHPSFCMMAHGNEPGGANRDQYLSRLVEYWKKKDNRRVYTSGAGWPYIENADYWNAVEPRIQRWGKGLNSIINAQPPCSDYDFREMIKKDMPTVSHEIGQWCVYPNFKEIGKYTGVLKAKNFEIFKETLEENNMGHLADDFLYASGKLQVLCYKADIEAALRTPGFGGFQLLDLHDFPGQGTALVGVLDAFWDKKGYVDGKTYSMFCSETVPLVRFPKMVWMNNEQMNVPVEFAHFGEKPLQNAPIFWTAVNADNEIVGKGRFSKDLPLDNCIPVGNIDLSFEQLKEPTQLTITVGIENTEIKNQWNIWVYPVQKAMVNNQPYISSKFDNTVIEKLNKGESVFVISPRGSVLPEKGGDIAIGFSSIFWNTAWTRNQAPNTLGILCDPSHPALSAFPNEGYSDYQWWDIVSDCDAMIMDDFPVGFKPIVYLIDDWFKNRKLGILFEAKVGTGKLVVCSSDLNRNPEKYPAAAQFKQSILEYMASDKFDPRNELKPEVIKSLFVREKK
ncbi:sugar-binding domain-containing protein [uncultured Parabacteroides sp.]|uniref:sugar-binding domain-containing protein n=1 Tax=uncultured Parabacteroides sp. TaxID=512312 RepID=UPI0025900DB0|nr:sugar-binding domain-containing protein [uncultured Parabacteroides sp.]